MDQVLLYLALALGVASMVLHVVAPKTKTLLDDKALEIIDEVIPVLPKSKDDLKK
jgi:hypothetical protein